jgi:hypothetical protein
LISKPRRKKGVQRGLELVGLLDMRAVEISVLVNLVGGDDGARAAPTEAQTT